MNYFGYLEGIYGIKTGFTNGANRCLATACKRNNMDIICIVLGADTKKFRTQDSINLIEYTFKNFSYINIEEKIQNELSNWKKENANIFNIEKGISQDISYSSIPIENEIFPIQNDLISKLNFSIHINTNLTAPIEKGYNIGYIEVFVGDSFLCSSNIVVDNYIPRKNFLTYFYEFIKDYDNSLSLLLKL